MPETNSEIAGGVDALSVSPVIYLKPEPGSDPSSEPPLAEMPPVESIKHVDEDSIHDLMDADLAPDELKARLVASIRAFEASFRKNFPVLWTAALVGPATMTVAALLVIGLFLGWTLATKFFWCGVATFFLFGRFIILTGVDGDSTSWLADYALSRTQLFWMVTYMDFMVALFVTFHMGILFRIPRIGPKIAGLTSDSKFIMERQPWMRRLAPLALTLFVAFPTSTTGSIGGSIFGRLLGLGRFRTLLGVFGGSLLGNGVMFYFAKEISDLKDGPYGVALQVTGIVLMVLAVVAIEMRYRKAKQEYMAEYEARHAGDAKPETDA